MQLLLFLSALLSGLTGVMAGERAVAPRQVEQVGVVSVAAVLHEVRAVPAAHRALVIAQPLATLSTVAALPHGATALVPHPRNPGSDTRRLE